MSQSTKVDSHLRGTDTATRVGGRQPVPGATPDYESAIRVLERCDSAACLSDFKENVVGALGSVLGLKHVSFFAGPTFQTTFSDKSPIVSGVTARMLPEYQDRWSHHDVFASPTALRMLKAGGLASVAELSSLGGLPMSATAYLRHFLNGTWRMEAAAAMRIDLFGMHSGLVGIFCEDSEQLGPAQLATLRILSRQLSAVARGIPFVSVRQDFRDLTERQREVIHLVAEGLSNAQIGETLSLAEDSVKKYVSRILATTGCHTRMELALLARTGERSAARRAPASS